MPDDSKGKKRWRRVVLIFVATPILAAIALFAFSWIVQWSLDARVVLLGEAHRVVVQIDRDSAIAREARWQMSRMHAAFRDAGIDVGAMQPEGATIRIFGVPESSRAAARAILARRLLEWSIDDESDPWRVTVPASQEERIVRSALAQTVDVLSDRLDQLGARTIRVQELSVENLRFEIAFKMLDNGPSVDDDTMFGNTAVLELREVASQCRLDGAGMQAPTTSAGIEICQGIVGDSSRTRPTVAAPIVAGSDFDVCYRSRNEWGDPQLNCLFSNEAKGRLWAFTSANRGREIALVEWEEGGCRVFLVVRIGEPFGDNVVFSGFRDEQTADNLALRTRAGRVPARVSVSH